MPPSLFILSILSVSLLGGSTAQNLMFGLVYNLTFNADFMYYQVDIPYNPVVPEILRVAILTYVPYETINVSASFTKMYPNYTNTDYYGTNKDGSTMRGVVWVDNIPKEDTTLYISVSKYEASVIVQPWQTKWFLLNFDDAEQYMSAIRAEFCDETVYPVTFSIVFPEVDEHSDSEVINPCGCTDVIVEDRDFNVISGFFYSAIQMFLLPSTITSKPLYGGLFYAGESGIPNVAQASLARKARQLCPSRKSRFSHDIVRPKQSRRTVPDEFTARLSLYGNELYPSVQTKYTKPNKVNDDLLANIDDTPYCDFWTSKNFTGYFSPYQFYSIDSACFLETHADEFEILEFETLVAEDLDEERTLIIHDFYKNDENKTETTVYFNIVHSNDDCGSYAYFNTKVPTKGWHEEVVTKEEWTPVAIVISVVFGFLFAVFFIATILLVSRLREFSRYNKIPH